MTKQLRIGIAGLGTMGRNHLRALLEFEGVEVVAVADPASEPLRAALGAASPTVRGFTDPLVMLREERLDAVVVATPTTLHFSVAIEALRGGVAALVEKPIAATADEGRQLVAAADASGSLLQIGHIERFNPAVEALVERLRAGVLSRIFSIKTVRAGPLPARIRDVGVAVDLASHDVDIMCHLLGETPFRAYAEVTRHVHTEHEDLLYGLLAFPSGAIGQLDVNWLTPEKQRHITVLGAEGMFQIDYLRQSLSFTRGASVLAPSYLDGYAPLIVGETKILPVKPAEPLRRELDAFLRAVRAGGPSPVSGRDGLAALELVDLLLASAQQGRPLTAAVSEID